MLPLVRGAPIPGRWSIIEIRHPPSMGVGVVTVTICILGIYLVDAAHTGPEDHAVARAAAEVLGISPAADQREVAAAFRRSSFRLHPEASDTQASDQARPWHTYETLCEAALALSALHREQTGVSSPAACTAAPKHSSLAVTELLLAAQRGDTDTALATIRGPCFTPWIEARDVRCSHCTSFASCTWQVSILMMSTECVYYCRYCDAIRYSA